MAALVLLMGRRLATSSRAAISGHPDAQANSLVDQLRERRLCPSAVQLRVRSMCPAGVRACSQLLVPYVSLTAPYGKALVNAIQVIFRYRKHY